MGALLVTCEGMMDCVRLWLRIKGTDHEPQRPTDHVRPRTFCFACYSPPLSPLISCHHYCNNWLKTYKNKKAVYSVTKNTLCKNCTCACMHVSASCPLVICKPHHNHIITAWVDKIVKSVFVECVCVVARDHSGLIIPVMWTSVYTRGCRRRNLFYWSTSLSVTCGNTFIDSEKYLHTSDISLFLWHTPSLARLLLSSF